MWVSADMYGYKDCDDDCGFLTSTVARQLAQFDIRADITIGVPCLLNVDLEISTQLWCRVFDVL